MTRIPHVRTILLSCPILALAPPSLASAGNTKVELCHNDEAGNTFAIHVSERAVAKHIANHGDFLLSDSVFYADADGDGAGDPDAPIHACNQPAGFVDNMDDECPLDGLTTEKQTYYWDADGDGFGDPATSTEACALPDGYVGNMDDCNDDDPLAWSGAREVPGDGVDNDCDPGTPDVVDCPCEALFESARTVWETQRGRGWNPTLLTGSNSICHESVFTNPNFRATDLIFSVRTFGAAGEGCYAQVREDRRESGGGVDTLVNTLIPYSTAEPRRQQNGRPAMISSPRIACRDETAVTPQEPHRRFRGNAGGLQEGRQGADSKNPARVPRNRSHR